MPLSHMGRISRREPGRFPEELREAGPATSQILTPFWDAGLRVQGFRV